MAFSDWETVAADNNTTLGVNIAEGCPAANINNALREVMAQMRAAIHPTLDSFLSSTSLSSARSALGVSGGSTSANNFGALTNAANKVPYMTGSDNWSTADFTSFGRSLVAAGDAATALALLGGNTGVTSPASSISSTSGYIKLNIGGTVFILQWKDGTASAGGATSFTYPTAYSSWSRAWVNTKDSTTDYTAQRNYPEVRSESTTGCTIYSASSASQSITVYSIGV